MELNAALLVLGYLHDGDGKSAGVGQRDGLITADDEGGRMAGAGDREYPAVRVQHAEDHGEVAAIVFAGTKAQVELCGNSGGGFHCSKFSAGAVENSNH